ncbi:MAG TPA: hypothetical protein VM120_21480 [Bryobacteraceae bacterium]|nr:hypothetical protein [Bryobacteraceae bacterium]
MKTYSKVPNIYIDGSTLSSADRTKYEQDIAAMLDRLLLTWAGWATLIEVYYLAKKKMTIVPYIATPENGVCNATAGAKDPQAATLKGTTLLNPNGTLPPKENRVEGTGVGSDTTVRFSPSTWGPSTGCNTGPGANADEILLHEMVHGVRQMAGRSVKEAPPKGSEGLTNYEEFVAILVSNIYRSEKNIPGLRKDHAGFAQLTAPDTDPAQFKTKFASFLSNVGIEQQRFANNLAQATCAFNPLRP